MFIKADGQSRLVGVDYHADKSECSDWLETAYRYLDDFLTFEGVPRYKLVSGAIEERTQVEIDADIAAMPAPSPTPQEQTDALMLDHEERIIYLELGVNDNAVSGS